VISFLLSLLRRTSSCLLGSGHLLHAHPKAVGKGGEKAKCLVED
jgi:hypothetical protein